MNNIQINISNASGSILGKLDLGEAEINTIFSLVDVREPDKKSANYTKTFTIPGTKMNHQIFSHIQTEGFEAWSYDPNFKLTAQILVNGNQYFNGYLQLNDLIKDDSDNIVGYNITVYQKFVDFYKNIQVKLNELIDISEYGHEYSYANIRGSWDEFIWKDNKKSSFNLGDGYVYPYDWRGQSDFRYYGINDFNPAIYMKTIVDKIFKSQGISYQSNFFESEYFRRLIMPYTGDREISLTKEQIDRSSTRVGMLNQPSNPNHPPSTANDIYLFEIDSRTNYEITRTLPTFTNESDTLNNYYDTNNNYIVNSMSVPKSGKYIFNVRLPLRILFTAQDVSGSYYSEIKTVGGPYELMVYIKKGGTILDSYKYTMTDPFYNQKKGAYTTDIVNVDEEYVGYFSSGDKISIEIKLIATGSNYTYKTLYNSGLGVFVQANMLVKLCLTNISSSYVGDQRPIFSMALVDEVIEEGDYLDMNAFLPDMKAVDLIKSLNKMFNLYWMPIGEDKFLIEPRNNFYIGGLIKDWTYALDEESEVKMEPLYELTANQFNFTYTEDSDYYNEDYFSTYEEVYSTKEIIIDNDFIEQTLDIKTNFSASPLVRFGSTDRKGVAYVDEDNNYKKSKPRILFYGGLLDTSTPWFIKSTINNYIFSGFTQYPYAGHLDNPDNPVYDLSWAVPQKYYYNWNKLVNNNLFNLFWRAQVEEITDKNGHLLTGTFILDDLDMISFDIRDTIQFRNVYYRVNKITHNPLLGVAEVELLKLKNYTAFTPSTISGNVASGEGNIAGTTWGWGYTKYKSSSITNISTGFNLPTIWRVPYIHNYANPTFTNTFELYSPSTSINNVISSSKNKDGSTFGDIIPTKTFYPTLVDKDNNFYSKQTSVRVLGQRNFVSPTSLNISISGDENKVGANVKNISISGNNNLIESSVENVTVVGDNQQVTRSNVSYIHGNIVDENGIRPNVSILRGGTGCVVSGGKNSVNASMIYNGGQDRV